MHIQTLKAVLEKKKEQEQAHNDTPIRIVRMRDLISRLGLSRTTIYLAAKNGQFPAPISLGPRAKGFLESEVNAWIESRAKAGHAGADE